MFGCIYIKFIFKECTEYVCVETAIVFYYQINKYSQACM